MRSHIARAGLLAAMVVASPSALAASADAVYFGGPIVTMDDKHPTAQVIHGQTVRAIEEDTKGSIEVGELADFAILSYSPLTIDRKKIADIKIVETSKKGRSIYRSDPPRVGDDGARCIESPRCYQRFVAWRSHGPMTELFGVPPHRH